MSPLNDPVTRRLRELLRAERERQGLTQRQLGARLGRPHSHIGNLENDRRITVADLIEVAHALGLDPVEVMRDLERVARRS